MTHPTTPDQLIEFAGDEPEERELFEKFVKSRYLCSEFSFTRCPDGYAHAVSHRVLRNCHADMQMLWESFQAGREKVLP